LGWIARYPAFCGGALLGLLVLGVYSAALTHEFVVYDDPVYVTNNPRVQQGLNWPNLVWAFTTSEAEFWHPLTWLSHMFDCSCWGLAPWGHHLTSVLLHLVNTLLVFAVFRRMTGALWRSWVVAALFGLHPLHVESVAWVAERKDVLSASFFMLTLGAYARYAECRRKNAECRIPVPQPTSSFCIHPSAFYFLSLFFFALGLMSKPMVVTLPFVLLLLDYWPLRRLPLTLALSPRERENALDGFGNSPFGKHSPVWPAALPLPKGEGRGEGGRDRRLKGHGPTLNPQPSTLRRLVWEKAPFFALSIAASGLAFWIQHSRGNLGQLDHYPMTVRLMNALVSYFQYMRRVFWPSDLAAFYPYPQSLSAATVLGAALVLGAISLAALWQLRRRPYLAVGWLWYAGMLFPVIGLVQVGHHAMADRYTYLPLIGLFVLLVWGVTELLAWWRCRKIVTALAIAAVVIGCAATTCWQARFWRTTDSLFKRALAVTSDNYKAHYCLGYDLANRRLLDPASAHFSEVLRIKPDHAEAHYSLGLCHALTGKTGRALFHYQEALRIKPDYAKALNNLAWLRATCPDQAFRNGAEAVLLAERAARLSERKTSRGGDAVAALDTLAAAYAEAGRFREAVSTAEKAEQAALAAGGREMAREIRSRIELYRAGQPYREP